jgi:hypothetical protein
VIPDIHWMKNRFGFVVVDVVVYVAIDDVAPVVGLFLMLLLMLLLRCWGWCKHGWLNEV